ncbi:MAG: hypothetical protein ACYTEQ_22375 [Planctomycetota bacterium]|jgi:hypothetical protein
MDEKDIYQFFRDAYEFEHERKDAINSRLSLVFTGLVVIIGAVTYFINNVRLSPINSLKIVFLALVATLLIVIVFAFYYLFRCVFSYEYRYIARPNLIETYVSEWKEYNRKTRDPVDIGEKIRDYLRSEYSDAASKNRANNKKKNGYFVRAVRAGCLAAIFVGILVVPFYILKVKEPEKVIYVNVKNLSEIRKMLTEEPRGEPFEPAPNPEPEPEPIEPVPPPAEDITEAEVDDSDIRAKTEFDE